MAEGVSKGFNRVLEINGVGYRAEVKGQEIHMTLGYSHPVIFPVAARSHGIGRTPSRHHFDWC